MTYLMRAFLPALLVAGATRAPGGPAAPATAPAADEPAYAVEARAVVQEVLSAPEFRLAPEGGRFWHRLGEWLDGLFGAVERGVERIPGWVAWVLVIWLVLALLAILAHLMYVLWGLAAGRGRRAVADRAGARGSVLQGFTELDDEQLYARALELVRAGDWSAAVQHLYMSAILWLDRAGFIAFRRVKTNLDLLRELATHPTSQAEFARLTTVFEATVYGGRPASAAQCRSMTAALETLRGSHVPSDD